MTTQLFSTNSTVEIIKRSVGEKLLWCNQRATVLESCFGRVLLEHDEDDLPHGGPQRWWIWSNGGGCGPSNRDVTDQASARLFFQREVQSARRYWAQALDGSAIIVKGNCYHDAGWSNSRDSFLGFAGAVWKIHELSTGKKWTTNNLWHNGVIPIEICPPDTHEFLQTKDDLPKSGKTPNTLQLSQEQARIVKH